jgi:hypothetical protein
MGIFDYIKSAFKVKYNLMGLAWFFLAGILTIPTLFWPIGIALEIIYLTTMAHNKKFQKLVNAQNFSKQLEKIENQKNLILNNLLSSDRKKKFNELYEKCKNLQQKSSIYVQNESIKSLEEHKIVTVNKLLWLFLKTLYYEQVLSDFLSSNLDKDIKEKIKEAQEKLNKETKEINKKNLESLLEVLNKRLNNITQTSEKLEAVKGYLLNLENLILLSQEQTISKGDPAYIENQINVTKGGLDAVEELVKTMDIKAGQFSIDEETPVFVKNE